MKKIIKLTEHKLHNIIERTVSRILSEAVRDEYFPDDEQTMDDYVFGMMATLTCNSDLTEEGINALQNVKDETIESENGFCSVLIENVEVVDDGFESYDIIINAAISAPEIPTNVIEDDVEEQIWYWVEEKTGERITELQWEEERVIFDRRDEKYK